MIWTFTIIQCDSRFCDKRFAAKVGSTQPVLEALKEGWKTDYNHTEHKDEYFCPQCWPIRNEGTK